MPFSSRNGFWIDRGSQNWGGSSHPRIVLVTQQLKDSASERQGYIVRRPHNQWMRASRTLDEIQDWYTQVADLAKAKRVWDYWYTFLDTRCVHGANCKAALTHGSCRVGNRHHKQHMISGAVLPLWKLLHEVVATSLFGRDAEGKKRDGISVRRGRLLDGTPVVGMTMTNGDYQLVLRKVQEAEAMGGVEAIAAAYTAGGLWAGLDGAWDPADGGEQGSGSAGSEERAHRQRTGGSHGPELLRASEARAAAAAAAEADEESDPPSEDQEEGGSGSGSDGAIVISSDSE